MWRSKENQPEEENTGKQNGEDSSMRGIVDRIEGELAVCEVKESAGEKKEEREYREIPLAEFDVRPREGDCFVYECGRARVDREETARRKDRIQERFAKLRKR